jgi:hypothetical protein
VLAHVPAQHRDAFDSRTFRKLWQDLLLHTHPDTSLAKLGLAHSAEDEEAKADLRGLFNAVQENRPRLGP